MEIDRNTSRGKARKGQQYKITRKQERGTKWGKELQSKGHKTEGLAQSTAKTEQRGTKQRSQNREMAQNRQRERD